MVEFQCKVMFLILLFVSIFAVGEALWFSLPAKGTKCVSESLHNNVVVLFDYVVIPDTHVADVHPPPSVTLKVTSPFGKIIHQNNSITYGQNNSVAYGQFAFTTSEAGNYQACFSADERRETGDLTVNIDWKTGIAAKDWESVAKKENIEGLELELKKLEGAVEAILENMHYIMTKDIEMRSVSDMTNSRVAWFSIMSVGVCIAASAVQIIYLKHYFLKKKLI